MKLRLQSRSQLQFWLNAKSCLNFATLLMPKIFSSLYILLDTGDTAKNELAIAYVLMPYSMFAPNSESDLTQVLV